MDNHPPSRLPRVLGLSDLTLFLVAALVNLNSVPVVAGMGPSALVFWLVGFLLFFLPQGVAVLELSARYPEEGGVYKWSKAAFGDFHGFLSGWCYWTNNIFYVPTLLFYIVGFAAFVGGSATESFGKEPMLMAAISLLLLWLITGVNVRGLGVGKWLQNIGAIGTLITTMIIFGIGLATLNVHGMANPLSSSSLFSSFTDWKAISLLSVVCLNYVGLELGSVMGDEIKNPRRNIPRAVLMAGVTTVTLYMLATFALQAAMPAGEIGVIDGILQAVKHVAGELEMAWIIIPIALLMTFNAAGNTSAWLAGSARIPFVIGIDRYLPAALGRVHPRYSTPHVALVVQGIASSLFIVISAVGSSVHDMYMILLQTTIILQLIPYLYIFSALLKFGSAPSVNGYFKQPLITVFAGAVGILVTAASVVLAFVPSNGIDDVWNFEFKLMLGTLGFLIPALLIYRATRRRLEPQPVLVHEIEVVGD